MAEKRRLLIDSNRLRNEIGLEGELQLTAEESHYLFRVMRMRSEDFLEVVDGEGHLWNTKVVGKKTISFANGFNKPSLEVLREKPLICMAVAIPKKGFDTLLAMSCEIGVDVIQPLISKRSVVKQCNNGKLNRYRKIISEAVEQSERLWSPQISKVLTFSNWISDLPSDSQIGFASTRIDNLQDCVDWLKETPGNVNQVWVVIGPEGGWDKDEEKQAFASGFRGISMGENILRTSTASVSACQLMTTWRRLNSSF
tara:strand:+ start:372 stop:1136 length:765 start_codon:yes stop_codon:yes gene_type:complete